MKGKIANMEVKKVLHTIIIVSTLMYAREIWTWNKEERSRIQAEMIALNYIRTDTKRPVGL